MLQKRCTLDGIKPSIDLEDSELLTRFFELIAGSGQDVTPAEKRPVAEAALRMRLLRICCKSVKAANMMPRTLEVLCRHNITSCRDVHCSGHRLHNLSSRRSYCHHAHNDVHTDTGARAVTLYRLSQRSVTRRPIFFLLQAIIAGLERTRVASVKLAACEFVVWVLRHADDGAMAAMAKPAYDRVIASLSMMYPSDSGPAMQLRGFLYQAVGELAQVRASCPPWFRASAPLWHEPS